MIKLKELFNKNEAIEAGPDGGIVSGRDDSQWVGSKQYSKTMLPTEIQPRKLSQVFGANVYSAYTFTPKEKLISKDISTPEKRTNLRHAVKYLKDSNSKNVVLDLIKDSVSNFKTLIKVQEIDLILPLASKSGLNLLIAEEMIKICPNAVIEKDLFKKKKWNDINIDSSKIDQEDSKKGGDLARNKLNNMKRLHGNEDFEMKQVSSMSLRRYFKDFMDIKHPTIPLNQLISGRTILIIDDTLEEGITLKDSVDQLKKYNPKEVYAYIFLMGRNSG